MKAPSLSPEKPCMRKPAPTANLRGFGGLGAFFDGNGGSGKQHTHGGAQAWFPSLFLSKLSKAPKPRRLALTAGFRIQGFLEAFKSPNHNQHTQLERA